MPRYSYTAQSLGGQKQSGIAEAKDSHQLARTLRQEGLILIKAELEEKEAKRKFEIPLPSLGGVPLTEKLMFTRNLQVMISAGLPLPKALEILALQTKSKKFKKNLLEIKEEITKGQNFSDSLAKHANIFSELYQNMVKVGEESGTLSNVLKILSQQIEREYELKSKINGALMYPAVIISAMIGIGIMMLIVVVPKLSDTFEELGIELPVTTRVVIFLGNFLAEKWYLAILAVVIVVFLSWLGSKQKSVKRIMDSLILKVPIISSLVRKTNSAYFVRTLGSLFASGVPIVRSLEIVSGTLGNFYFKEALIKVAEKVREGAKLSEALEPYQNIYPLIILQMLKVGEETGQTADILIKLADFFEEEVGNATKNITSIIEPILMLIIGGVIGFFAISMVQPMYSMLEAI